MKINDPYVYLLPNNQTFELIQNSQGLVLVNLKLIVFNSTVDGNISFYRQSKPTFEFIYPIVTPVVIEWKYADITKIDVTDTNSYDYYLKVQYINFSDKNEYNQYLEQYQVDPNIGSSGSDSVNIIPYNTTNKSLASATSGTINTKLQFTITSTLVRHFTFVNTSTGTINIGDSNNQPIPVASNTTFEWNGNNETTDLSQWYTYSSTAGADYVIVYQY